MTTSDRELVAAIRTEIAAIDPNRSCDRSAEWAGLTEGASIATLRDPAVQRLAVRLERFRPGDEPTSGSFDWERRPEHCRTAWLRGRFLARGSLSLAGGRTHLEFVVDPVEAPVLAARLSATDGPASWRIRRGRGVVTWKRGEAIETFLQRLGAGAALLEWEARSVSRALRGELNRVLNAESANVRRSVAAAGRQLDAIDRLEVDGRLALQPHLVRLIADVRRETPEATLAEIAERVDAHRSAVQRALERLERLADTVSPGEDAPGPRHLDGRPLA